MAALALVEPSGASAHSSLEESTPAQDATVQQFPDEVILRFSNPVTVPDGKVRVLDLNGTDYTEPGIEVDGTTVTVPVRRGAAGTRVVGWTAISDHGTPINGSFAYDIRHVTAGADAAGDGSGPEGVRAEVVDLARGISLAGLVLALVASAFVIARRRSSADGAGNVLIGTCATAALAALVGLVAHNQGNDSLDTAFIVVFVVAALLALVWTRVSRAWLAPVSGSLAVAAILTLTLNVPAAPVASTIEQRVSLADGAAATVTLEPARAGLSSMVVRVVTADGTPDAVAQEAQVRYRPADGSLGYFRAILDRDTAGTFSADEVLIPFAGDWDFEIQVAKNDFESALANFSATMQPNARLS